MLIYCKRDWTMEQVTQRDCGVSILGDIQNPAGPEPGPEQPGLVDSALSIWGGLDYLQGPYQPVILWSLNLSKNAYLSLKQPRRKIHIWSTQKGSNSLKAEKEVVG